MVRHARPPNAVADTARSLRVIYVTLASVNQTLGWEEVRVKARGRPQTRPLDPGATPQKQGGFPMVTTTLGSMGQPTRSAASSGVERGAPVKKTPGSRRLLLA